MKETKPDLLDKASQYYAATKSLFAASFATLLSIPAVLATGYKIFGGQKYTQAYSRIFHNKLTWGIAATAGVLNAVASYFVKGVVNDVNKSQLQSLNEENSVLRAHASDEGLTLSFNGSDTSLKRIDGKGNEYSVNVAESDDEHVLLKFTKDKVHPEPSAMHTHIPHESFAQRATAEKEAAASAAPVITK